MISSGFFFPNVKDEGALRNEGHILRFPMKFLVTK